MASEIEPCAACGEKRRRDSFLSDLARCSACGHVVAANMPSAEDLQQLYSNTYFIGGEYFDYIADRAAAEANARRHLRVLGQFSRNGRMLEIGCGYGFFINLARARWDVEGVDIAAHAIRYASGRMGLNARCGDFLELNFAGAYDVLCLWDTIEHLRNPERYVAKASRLLRHGGILALTTGDIGSRVARFQGRRWRLIHPPSHLHYFTRASLSTLLHRHGFHVDAVHYEPQYRSLRQVAHSLVGARRPSLRRLIGKLGHLPGAGFTFGLNLYDIMLVVARREHPVPHPNEDRGAARELHRESSSANTAAHTGA